MFDTPSATPWIAPAELRRHGALYVLADGDPVPAGVSRIVVFDLVPRAQGRAARSVRFGVLPPDPPCE